MPPATDEAAQEAGVRWEKELTGAFMTPEEGAAWERWDAAVSGAAGIDPETATLDLKVWPHLLPAPPPEPPGLWEHLRSVAGEGGEHGLVALYFLIGFSAAA